MRGLIRSASGTAVVGAAEPWAVRSPDGAPGMYRGATSVGSIRRRAPSSLASFVTNEIAIMTSSRGRRLPTFAVNTFGRSCSSSVAP
jgi:hypothetical protein